MPNILRSVFVIGTFILWLTCSFQLLAQNASNYLEVQVNSGLNFFVTEATDLTTTHTLPNALTLKVRTKNSNCSVFAKLNNYSAPSGFYPSSSPLFLQWISDTSPNAANVVTSATSLETYDKLLFSQPKANRVYKFNYNFLLQGLSYDFPPGNYNFTLKFTMTQP